MENIITKCDQMTDKIIKSKYSNNPKGLRTQNAITKAKAKAKAKTNTDHTFENIP